MRPEDTRAQILYGEDNIMAYLITSRKNEIIKQASKLCSSADYRREQALYITEGARLCCDAALSSVKIKILFYTSKAMEKYGKYIDVIKEKAEQIYEIESHIAPMLSETKSPQGIFCMCKMENYEHNLPDIQRNSHYIALENIQDPANLGGILRTAEALGVGGVILTNHCCDIYSPKVLRASMGAIFRLPFYIQTDTVQTIEKLNKLGFTTLAAVPDSEADKITEVNFNRPTVIIVGNEGNGLNIETIKVCSKSVTIPMLGRAESLNASASAAILMWEMMRKKSGGVL